MKPPVSESAIKRPATRRRFTPEAGPRLRLSVLGQGLFGPASDCAPSIKPNNTPHAAK